MNKEIKLAIAKDRFNRLKENGKNEKTGGTLRKIARQIRNMEK